MNKVILLSIIYTLSSIWSDINEHIILVYLIALQKFILIISLKDSIFNKIIFKKEHF
jgi:hypothetical protein